MRIPPLAVLVPLVPVTGPVSRFVALSFRVARGRQGQAARRVVVYLDGRSEEKDQWCCVTSRT